MIVCKTATVVLLTLGAPAIASPSMSVHTSTRSARFMAQATHLGWPVKSLPKTASGLESTNPEIAAADASTCNNLIHASQNQVAGKPILLYRSSYLFLLLLFLGITLPAHFFRRRMITMKGRMSVLFEERSRISRECHDTLMAGFAAISWQLEATSKLFQEDGLHTTPAAQSCELARNMVAHCQDEARRIIWDLRETDDVSGILSQALARALAANHLPATIETRLQVQGEEVPLAPGCVHHLVCIGQEAVTNALRHARPSLILVTIKFDPSNLYLSIRDDGSGFQRDRGPSRHGHFGVAMMEERARKLGGSFRIEELDDRGTAVTVKIPFNTTHQRATSAPQVVRWIGI